MTEICWICCIVLNDGLKVDGLMSGLCCVIRRADYRKAMFLLSTNRPATKCTAPTVSEDSTKP
jgi:hypothetical protein